MQDFWENEEQQLKMANLHETLYFVSYSYSQKLTLTARG